jgi:pimeloyl-ACP methyl ester carboxylesterase
MYTEIRTTAKNSSHISYKQIATGGAMKKWIIVILIITGNFTFLSALSSAQDSPVSVVETGKTPGFEPPTLYLTPCAASHFLLPKLVHNRTLHEPFLINQDKDLGEVGAPIDYTFMVKMIFNEVKAFNQFADPYDDPARPSAGYSWQLKIFHPGSSPGKLPAEGAPYHIIIFCVGAGGSDPVYYNAMDWLGNYYARRGYLVAIPIFIGNDADLSGRPFYEIATDIYALQVSQTIDYLRHKFRGIFRSPVDTGQVTVMGHSLGGYVAQKTAVQDCRIARLCLLSSAFVYQQYWPGFLVDTADTYDLLNGFPKKRGMALHVQRFTRPPYNIPCPDFDPECDWIPPVDGFITQVDLSADPWEPHLCSGENCGVRDGTLYNYVLYQGPKQDGIKNNILLDHTAIVMPGEENDAGRLLILQYLDEFFTQFPLDFSYQGCP